MGTWAQKKIYFIAQYFGIFATGMHNKWKLNYVEICSGPGKCIDRKSGYEFDGTALSVLKHDSFKYLKNAFFFDYDQNVVSILNQRIQSLLIPNAKAYVGDYCNANSICDVLRSQVTSESLNLVVIDPTDCSVPFSCIESLKSTLSNMDIIINVATRMDFNRNVDNILSDPKKYADVKDKYEAFLNKRGFFDSLRRGSFNVDMRKAFRDAFKDSLSRIGYSHFEIKEVENYYDILFASESERGLDFWNKANKLTFDGQYSLF
ncbi:MAG: three-Cys-motif partner protein TcmP [Bacteroidales bacterium]|nr:three-Cys-motif partner protein TcmP [Bacteroidales bacterium]